MPGPKPVDPETLFWRHVIVGDKEDACWSWVGSTTAFGYGNIKSYQRKMSAHRVSYEIHFGPIPSGMQVCHTCDNPRCSNPKHLFLGTPKDNSVDMHRKNRFKPNGLRGEKQNSAKLTEAKVRAIRKDTRTLTAIAKEYGVSHVLIGKIRRREIWKHVAPEQELLAEVPI